MCVRRLLRCVIIHAKEPKREMNDANNIWLSIPLNYINSGRYDNVCVYHLEGIIYLMDVPVFSILNMQKEQHSSERSRSEWHKKIFFIDVNLDSVRRRFHSISQLHLPENPISYFACNLSEFRVSFIVASVSLWHIGDDS